MDSRIVKMQVRVIELWGQRASWLPVGVRGLVAGLVAALACVVVMGLLRLWWGTPTPPELLGEFLLPHMTANQFVAFLIAFQPNPKTSPLGLALLGQIVLFSFLGAAFALVVSRGEERVSRRTLAFAGGLVAGMELVALALFWPVLSIGLFGDTVAGARWLTSLSLLLTFATYAAVLLVAYYAPRPAFVRAEALATRPVAPSAISRRQALITSGAVVLYVGVAALATNQLIGAYLKRSTVGYDGLSTPSPGLQPITPTDQFYVVTKNVLDPTVDASRWRLEVRGLVHHERTWTYAETLALPAETRAVTLECISNSTGGHLLATTNWTGISLEHVLGLAGGAERRGKYVIFTSVDGYRTSLPLADLLGARTMLAWKMNGEPLPMRHGFPLRAVVPGRYGEQSAKWLTRIDVVDQPFLGFYQSQGWSDAQVSTTSRIDSPSGKVKLGAVTIAGVAFAGIRGIKRVEVSADGGATWHDAALDPPPSDQTWVLWRWQWNPPAPGSYSLTVRATDGTGEVQTEHSRGTVPMGATGRHVVKVEVAA